jgi:YD repeat-containing protein
VVHGEYRLTEVSACASGSAPSCVGTSAETRSVFAYDANANITSAERRSGNTTGVGAVSATSTMTYGSLGDLLTVDGPLLGTADTTRYRYNAARQVIGVIGPDPDGGSGLKHRAVRTTYRADGLPTKVEQGTVNSQSDADWAAFSTLQEVQQDYDATDRPTVQRLLSGSTTYALTQTGYDGLGRVRCVAQRMNPAEFSSLPADACTLDTEGSFGPDRIIRNSYDAASQVTLVHTGYGVTGTVADEVATVYTNNGQVQHVTDANGNRTTYEYDGHDRLMKTRFPHPTATGTSSTTDFEQLTLDANDNVTSRRLRDTQSLSFTYDALNRVTGMDRPGSAYGEYDLFYAYDNLDRLASASGTNGLYVNRTHDALGGGHVRDHGPPRHQELSL